MTLILAADRLTKWYGRRLAVEDVSFEVRQGEVMGLLGPNGSGKSTILRVLTGYLRPSAGTARIAGFDVVTQGLEVRRRVGYVPEDVPLYTNMRVSEFLMFMGKLRGLWGHGLAAAVSAVYERVSLASVQNLLISQLSRGYRQRVAIAQALMGDPQLLVLDEPTNGLDPRQIIELRELIRALSRSCAVLVTSHVLAEVERIAHRAAILLGGRLLTVHTLVGDTQGYQVRLRLRAPDSQSVALRLESVQGVSEIQPETASDGISVWRVRVADTQVAERLAASLVEARLGVQEITPVASDLESLFLRLTGQEASK
ncbi:MAG TPA: ABC transporter ATP-binding protein [Burkholderiales bacterium]|nr:ABC transporter ATP-binding protein [Burkholderiales bacterium]